MTLVSQMRGTPPTHVVRMRTAPTVGHAPTVGPKPLLSRPRVTAGLAVGLRARVLPTGKFPPLGPCNEKHPSTDDPRGGSVCAEEDTQAGEIYELHRGKEIGRPIGPPLPRSAD